MDIQIWLLLGTVLAALVLFSLEKIPADVIALGVLLFLILSGLLPVDRAFAGFGSDVVLMILGILVMMEALARTGVTELIGRRIIPSAKVSETRLLAVIMGIALVLGAFMSNTAATAFLLPLVTRAARRARYSSAKFLMPLAFASILASSTTLISTSTNIIVSGIMTDYGLPPMGMFELTLVGVPIAIFGLTYMITLGRRLVPDRIPVEQIEDFSVPLYFTELLILPDSPLVGKSLSQVGFGRDFDLTVLRIVCEDRRCSIPQARTQLQEGDILLVEGGRENLLRIKEEKGIDIRAEVELSIPDMQTGELGMVEVILLPGSPLVGRTLKGLNFRDRYHLQVLAINRHGEKLRRKMSHIRLRTGDMLVMRGDREQIALLEKRGGFRVLSSFDRRYLDRSRAPRAVAIFVGAVVITAFDLISLPVAMLLGALMAFATRCVTPEEAYSRINWKVLIMIACMLGLGAAMEITGTAEFLADQIVRLIGKSQPTWLLTGFFFLTMLLTQPMSNQAAAAVTLPVAVQAATQLGLNPRSFAVMIALAASCSFLTPLEPACLLVYGPGRYRFMDFLKVGLIPTVITYLIAIIMVPLLWPLNGIP